MAFSRKPGGKGLPGCVQQPDSWADAAGSPRCPWREFSAPQRFLPAQVGGACTPPHMRGGWDGMSVPLVSSCFFVPRPTSVLPGKRESLTLPSTKALKTQAFRGSGEEVGEPFWAEHGRVGGSLPWARTVGRAPAPCSLHTCHPPNSCPRKRRHLCRQNGGGGWRPARSRGARYLAALEAAGRRG